MLVVRRRWNFEAGLDEESVVVVRVRYDVVLQSTNIKFGQKNRYALNYFLRPTLISQSITMVKSDVYIVSAARTPIGSFRGCLSNYPAHDLGSVVIKEAMKRANLESKDVTEVVLGQTLTTGGGANPARQAAIKAGIPYTTPAYSVNMLCGSGLKAISIAYQAICCNESDIIIAGGQESMSQSPHFVSVRNGIKMGNTELIDTMLHDCLIDPFYNIHMGETAENIAKEYSIPREEQDKFALESQKKTCNGQTQDCFAEEIVPVTIETPKEVKLIQKDEYPRGDTTLEGLCKLKPVFIKEGGTVTAGNASGLNDGAAAVVLMSSSKANERNIKPMAKIVGVAQAGVDPRIMGIGPVPAVKKLLENVKWTVDEVDLFEINEAFAAQSIAVIKALGLNKEKVNVNGGAISLGHPIGASGARILVSLLYALKDRQKKKGIAALCVGGGMGISIAVEMCL